jgi:hypothetical protein
MGGKMSRENGPFWWVWMSGKASLDPLRSDGSDAMS